MNCSKVNLVSIINQQPWNELRQIHNPLSILKVKVSLSLSLSFALFRSLYVEASGRRREEELPRSLALSGRERASKPPRFPLSLPYGGREGGGKRGRERSLASLPPSFREGGRLSRSLALSLALSRSLSRSLTLALSLSLALSLARFSPSVEGRREGGRRWERGREEWGGARSLAGSLALLRRVGGRDCIKKYCILNLYCIRKFLHLLKLKRWADDYYLTYREVTHHEWLRWRVWRGSSVAGNQGDIKVYLTLCVVYKSMRAGGEDGDGRALWLEDRHQGPARLMPGDFFTVKTRGIATIV